MIAALLAWHEQHEQAAAALRPVTALPAHVMTEAYAVLTRLPLGFAVAPRAAARVLTSRFGGAPLCLDDAARRILLGRLADAGVFGGASYDALVAMEAAAHDRTLLTLDERAQATYQRLGIAVRVIAA